MASFRDVGALQHGALDIGALQSSGVVSSSINVSDSFTISDAASFSLSILFLSSDTLNNWNDSYQYFDVPVLALLVDTLQWNWSDSISLGFASIPFTFNDSLSFTDAATIAGVQPAFLFTDALSVIDSNTLVITLPFIFNDSYTISDGAVVQNLFVIGLFLSEFNNIQDGLITQVNILLAQAINDSFTITDVLLLSISIPLRFGDIIPPYSDFIQKGGLNTLSILLRDFLLFSDASLLRLSRRYVLDDSNIPLDSLTYSLNSSGNAFNDSYTLNDAVLISISQPVILSLSDSLSFSDAVTEQLPEPLNAYIRRYLNDVVA